MGLMLVTSLLWGGNFVVAKTLVAHASNDLNVGQMADRSDRPATVSLVEREEIGSC